MPHLVELKDYVAAAAESSRRARTVFLVMIVASVVAFSASWNSSSSGWLLSRLRVHEDVIRWWDDFASGRPLSTDLAVDESLRARYAAARSFLDDRAPVDEWLYAEVKYELDLLRQAKMREIVLITIPFFGVRFDINDLSVLAGFGFTVILLWFALSVSSEQRDLQLTFMRCEEIDQLRTCYDMLLVRQVLTTPPDPTGEGITWFRGLASALYLLPALVQAKIVWYDIRSFHFGAATSAGAALRGLLVGSGFLVVICGLTVASILMTREIDRLWLEKATKLGILPRLEPASDTAAAQGEGSEI